MTTTSRPPTIRTRPTVSEARAIHRRRHGLWHSHWKACTSPATCQTLAELLADADDAGKAWEMAERRAATASPERGA